MSGPQYQIHQFAELAGVTVRALHHYNRLGLLRPKRRSNGRYRVYGRRDLERLEQIVALKCLGLPLAEIRNLLDRDGSGLLSALRRQRRLLEEKRRRLESAVGAIHAAERDIESGQGSEVEILKRIIKEMQMQSSTDWMMKYYSDEAAAKIRERSRSWTPEMLARAEQDWAELFRDVEAALGEDPAGETAQALARRWEGLVSAFTGQDPRITEGLGKLHADRNNWPADFQEKMSPFSNPAVWEFIRRALSARRDG